MTKLSCGVIGLGRLGFRHAETLAGRTPGARLTAVADPAQGAIDRLTDLFPAVKGYRDYHDLIAAPDVEAVVIASPTNMHFTMLMECMHAGKKIFCEKPLTLEKGESAILRTEAAERNAFIQVGFMRRFDRSYVVARKRLESGELGLPVSIRCTSRDPAPPSREFAVSSGGLIMDLCIHDIDLARWFMQDEVAGVYAQGGLLMCDELRGTGDIDHANVLLTFRNGGMGDIEASRNARYGYDVRTEVVCTKGTLLVGDLNYSACIALSPDGSRRDVMPWFLERFDQAYVDEIREFVATVLAAGKSRATLEDGLTAVEIALAAKASRDSGVPVRLGGNEKGEVNV